MQRILRQVQNFKLQFISREKINHRNFVRINRIIVREIERYNKVTDTSDKSSLISRFNDSIVFFKGTKDFFLYFDEAINWFENTNGIFNPFAIMIEKSFKNLMDDNWQGEGLFKINKIMFDFPKTRKDLNQFLIIDRELQRIEIKRKTYLDLSGISKGVFLNLLSSKISRYAKNFQISFGGDNVFVSDDNNPWKFKIENPIITDRKPILINANNESISISGFSIQKKYVENMQEYILLDPKKQLKTSSQIAMVIVKSANPIMSDVLAKCFIIAENEERDYLNSKFKEITKIIIDNKGEMIIN